MLSETCTSDPVEHDTVEPDAKQSEMTDCGGLESRVETRTSTARFPDQTFDAIVFDWDGTAVPDRRSGAEQVRLRVEASCRAGLDVVVVSGTHLANIDGQLGARPSGPGRLWLCVNRGSQVALVGPSGPEIVQERRASNEEDAALDRAAALVVDRLGARGLTTRIVSQRMNRRKIDLIDDPRWADPPKAQIGALLEAVTDRLVSHGIAGLDEAVAVAVEAAVEAGLRDPRVTTDAKHLEIGLTDKSDSLRYILHDLSDRGIGAGLIVIVGDEMGPLGGVAGSDAAMLIPEARRSTTISVGVEPEGVPEGVLHLPGGPSRFLALIDDQLARRATRRVPAVDLDPRWIFAWKEPEPALERVRESLLVVSNGYFGTRGYREEDGTTSNPMVVASGVYDHSDGVERYLVGPRWADLELDGPSTEDEWLLDLRSGVLARTRRNIDGGSDFRSVRFASRARPGTMALRAEGDPDRLRPGPPLVLPHRDEVAHGTNGTHGSSVWASVRSSLGGGITAAAHTRTHTAEGRVLIERLAHYLAEPGCEPNPEMANQGLDGDVVVGFDKLLSEHRRAWAQRWACAEVSIAGDPEAELAVRFALFHLMACVRDEGEAGVGARGLSGAAYSGHVFWDADVFVLPVLAATHAPAAEAMLRYRLGRLEAASANATAEGRLGARFPWESASTGVDVTPRSARDARGATVAILTGQAEEHIVADIAWAAWHAAAWSGDRTFLLGHGRSLIIETARYWASRAEWDADTTAHLRGVIGPDEYHELVDDNAFTNVMAAWNLRRGADLVEEIIGEGASVDVTAGEVEQWRRVADALVNGYDPHTGLYEQFAGFTELEPLVISELASPPVAADILLGRERVAGAQIVKQADVLMLHHLIPEACVPGSLVPNLAFYAPRTAHGSSLSPAIHAGLFARAGRANEALDHFRLACRIDLDDLTGTTAGGLHMAGLAGIWHAVAFGFVGLWPHSEGLVVDPHLPDAWEAVEIAVVFRGVRVRVRAEDECFVVSPEHDVTIVPGAGQPILVRPPGTRFIHVAGTRRWEEHY